MAISDINDTIPCYRCGFFPFEHPREGCDLSDRIAVLKDLEKMEFEEEEQHEQ